MANRVHEFQKSMSYAWKGIVFVFRNEQNFRIQLFVAILVLSATFFFGLKRSEIVVILLLICLILVLEMLNSALERFADVLKPRLHEQIRVVKNITAAIVLVASVGALVIGTIIFYPYLFSS